MVSPVAVAITVAVVVLALAGMLLSWRRRTGAQRDLRLPAGAVGDELASAVGLYLVTTFAGRPLDRVVAGGLGFRAQVRVAVGRQGVEVDRAGAAPFTIPLDRITGAGTGSWALDRGVEREGLAVVAWSLDGPEGAVPVESAFRIDDAGQAAVLTALRDLVPSRVPDTAPDTPEVPRADR